ncbi:MAG: hypothetical protein BroJett011_45690 [Chloroflexota bacterium]|nr:MAG: hypothetical protein BroJett011_45690 [Chloroflexota bacterium]
MTTPQGSFPEELLNILKPIFAKLGPKPKPGDFITEFRKITDKNFLLGFEELAEPEQEKWIEDLYQISHQEKLTDEEWTFLLSRITEPLDKLFEVEMVGLPPNSY